MSKTVYVLNGYAPEKLMYFNTRPSLGIKSVLLDNGGDNYNAANFEYLINKDILNDKNAYVLITSEYQLKYISDTPKVLSWFKDHYNQFYGMIKTDITRDNPSQLVNKSYVWSKLKNTYCPNIRIMRGSEWNLYPRESKLNYMAKLKVGSGTGGIIPFIKDKKDTLLNDDDLYVIEPIYLGDNLIHFSPVVLFTGHHEVSIANLTSDIVGKKLDTRTAWSPLWVTTKFDDILKEALINIQDTFNIISGCMEPEFIYNKDTHELILIDHNPRWSLDFSLIKTEAVGLIPEDFDMLDHVINSKPFSLREGISSKSVMSSIYTTIPEKGLW